jgi:hypothetical protein
MLQELDLRSRPSIQQFASAQPAHTIYSLSFRRRCAVQRQRHPRKATSNTAAPCATGPCWADSPRSVTERSAIDARRTRREHRLRTANATSPRQAPRRRMRRRREPPRLPCSLSGRHDPSVACSRTPAHLALLRRGLVFVFRLNLAPHNPPEQSSGLAMLGGKQVDRQSLPQLNRFRQTSPMGQSASEQYSPLVFLGLHSIDVASQ